jgi:hypothetical protein
VATKANGGIKSGLALGLAMEIQEQIDRRLGAIERETRLLREFFTNKKHFELSVGGNAESGEETTFTTHVPTGHIFTGQRLVGSAPEGAKLQIYQHSVSPNNLIENAANFQEYADGILGPMVVVGMARIFFVITGTKKAGAVTIRLIGELVKVAPQSVHVEKYK